jgi:hypothetical protein
MFVSFLISPVPFPGRLVFRPFLRRDFALGACRRRACSCAPYLGRAWPGADLTPPPPAPSAARPCGGARGPPVAAAPAGAPGGASNSQLPLHASSPRAFYFFSQNARTATPWALPGVASLQKSKRKLDTRGKTSGQIEDPSFLTMRRLGPRDCLGRAGPKRCYCQKVLGTSITSKSAPRAATF